MYNVIVCARYTDIYYLGKNKKKCKSRVVHANRDARVPVISCISCLMQKHAYYMLSVLPLIAKGTFKYNCILSSKAKTLK